MSRFAQMLEEARTRKGLSRERAAKELETSSTTYRSWLRGQRPEWDRVPAIVGFIDDHDEGEVLKALVRHGGTDPYTDGTPTGANPRYLNSGRLTPVIAIERGRKTYRPSPAAA